MISPLLSRNILNIFSSFLFVFATFHCSANNEISSAQAAFNFTDECTAVTTYIESSIPQKEYLIQAVPEGQKTMHIFSHGKPGSLLIDGVWLDTLAIKNWIQKNYDTQDYSYLNIYGCNFAQGEKGKKAVAFLQNDLGLLVAASTNLTGKDGDWKLEIGNVSLSVDSYAYNLQCTGFPTEDCDGDGIVNEDDIDDDNDGILDDDECASVLQPTVQSSVQAIPSGGSLNYDVEIQGGAFVNVSSNVLFYAGGISQNIPPNSVEWPSSNQQPSSTALSVDYNLTFTGPVSTLQLLTYDFDGVTQETIENFSTAPTSISANATDIGGGVYTSTGENQDITLFWDLINPITTVSFRMTRPITSRGMSFSLLIDRCLVDFDSDGIINSFDLDSDNDGIPDNIEAQSTTGYVAPTGVVGLNGLDAAYENNDSFIATGLNPQNTDGTGFPDHLDLDADDDGIFDIVESGDGLTDADNDGRTDGVVGANGLDSTVDNGGVDDYSDPNGKFDDTQDNNFTDTDGDVNSGGDVDYRDDILFAIDVPVQVVLENNSFTSVAPSQIDTPTGVITYTLSGVDANRFTIDSSTGIVSMVARDFENPEDDNVNNFYNLTITATSSTGGSASDNFTVIVNNVCEIVETLQNTLSATDPVGDVTGDTGTLQVAVVDGTGTPRVGVTVTITKESGPGIIAAATGVTNASGIYTTTVSSTTAGIATYSAQYAATTGVADTDVELGNPTLVRFLDDVNNLAVTGEVGIATDAPHPSSVLEVVGTDKGLLVPNVALRSSSDTVTIPRPTVSLMVYNTNDTASLAAGFVFFDGTQWVPFCQERVVIRQ